MKKLVKTIVAVIVVFFGISIVSTSISQFTADSAAGTDPSSGAAGALIGNLFLLATGCILVLIALKFIHNAYFKKTNSQEKSEKNNQS